MEISSPPPQYLSKKRTSNIPKNENYTASPCTSGTVSADPESFAFTTLTEYEEIELLLPEWRELFSRMLEQKPEGREMPPFSRPDVLVNWAKVAESKMDSLFVVAMRDRETNTLRGVFPGFLERHSARMLTDLVTDYQDISAVTADDGIALVLSVIELTRSKGYRLAFHQVAESSLLWECLEVLSRSQCCLVKRLHGPCPNRSFEIPEGEGDFLRALSKKRRKNHKAAASKIRKGIPNGRVEHLQDEQITAGIIEEIATLHINNQYRKSGQSIFEKQSMREWLLSLSKVESDLCASLFYDGDELVAFNLAFIDKEQSVFYYYIPSFCGKYLSYSIGTWLMVEALRHHAPADGGSFKLDLLCGDEGYKKLWSTDRYHIWRIVLFPGGFSNVFPFCFYKFIYSLKAIKNRFRAFLQRRNMEER